MGKIDKAADIYRSEGVLPLARTTISYLHQRFEQKARGGVSSRSRIQDYAGIFCPMFNTVHDLCYGGGFDPIDRDWDNLILLDACRYDDFKSQNTIPGTLEKAMVGAADSHEFVMRYFNGRELHDTVYVSANPHVRFIDDGVFHAINSNPVHHWDSEVECVRPSSVTKAAIESHESYPNKRLIIHYMQPHDPPIGLSAAEYRRQFDLGGPVAPGQDSSGPRIMEAVADGDIPVQEARELYRENIDLVIDEVEKLLTAIDGKSVISADHGEMFGEKPYPLLGELYEHYRHPRNVHLCEVPWLAVEDYEERREVTAENPRESERIDDNKISEQLEALGYT